MKNAWRASHSSNMRIINREVTEAIWGDMTYFSPMSAAALSALKAEEKQKEDML